MYQSGTNFKSTNQGNLSRIRKFEYIIDETAIKAGSKSIWLWVVIDPKDKEILVVDISKKRKYICCQTISV